MTVSEEDQILIDHLSTNKNEFNQFVYTPLEEAVSLLTKRRANLLESKLSIPSPLEKDSRAVLFRQVLTSNYEARRFLNLIESTELKPLFFEYYKDKFTSNNEFKHSLGRLLFYKGRGKKDGMDRHWTLAPDGIYEEKGESARTVERPQLQKMLPLGHRWLRSRAGRVDDYPLLGRG
jgi:hypothetical protein